MQFADEFSDVRVVVPDPTDELEAGALPLTLDIAATARHWRSTGATDALANTWASGYAEPEHASGIWGATVAEKIRLLITDLDNTLYDWVTFFATSFYAMVEVAAPLLEIDFEELLDQLKKVHQEHRSSEHPFALLETEATQRRYGKLSRQEQAEQLSPAFRAFDEARARTLRVYPGVRDTLGSISATKCFVAAHTEASAVNAASRLRRLDLVSLIPRLYALAPAETPHPDPTYVGALASWGGRVRFLHEAERKPDVRVIFDICRDHGIPPEQTLYVGDSLWRDVGMAKKAGAQAAWAEYGSEYDRGCWKQLVRITHWTDEDVAQAQQVQRLYHDAFPDAILKSFSDLLQHFDFA